MPTFLATVRKNKFWMEHLELELEADIWWFCSTQEYYKTTKYELPTPTLSAPSRMHFPGRVPKIVTNNFLKTMIRPSGRGGGGL